ncbi:methyltransferase domain-containing protein [Cetobacterium sp. SF1]|uniref:methyltransferase domain-containing protein n=1 Tax=Cetobacterium sp. SF1 TaxID=3417654 RepID=UPI003CEB9EB8
MNFNKNFKTYNDEAFIQTKVANNLLKYIDINKTYDNILELGCGTGIFSKLIFENISYNSLDLNDYFDSTNFLEGIKYNNFFQGDMQNLNLHSYSLICSSSSLQWIDDLDTLFFKISKNCEEFIFSIYIKDNLIEIKNHFGISLNYKTFEEINLLLEKYFIIINAHKGTYTLEFDSPLSALKHLKKTGVTGIGKTSVSLIKTFKNKTLTYKVAYFKCKKKGE